VQLATTYAPLKFFELFWKNTIKNVLTENNNTYVVWVGAGRNQLNDFTTFSLEGINWTAC
jgi:hypothetical protein